MSKTHPQSNLQVNPAKQNPPSRAPRRHFCRKVIGPGWENLPKIHIRSAEGEYFFPFNR